LCFVQYIAPRQEWIADVVTFRDEGGGVFREEKRRRTSEYLPLAKLAPVKASYVRAVDGWKVPVTKEGAVKPDKPVSPAAYCRSSYIATRRTLALQPCRSAPTCRLQGLLFDKPVDLCACVGWCWRRRQGFYVPPDFALPMVVVDPLKAANFQEAYEALKVRLLKETLVSIGEREIARNTCE